MNLRTKAPTKWVPAGERVDPYREARQEWDRRDGTARAQKHKWQLACYGLVGVTALSQIGLVYLGAQPKVVPRYVEIDRIGAAHYRGPAGSAETAIAPERAIRHQLRRFVTSVRTISSDPGIIKANLFEAYAMVTPTGRNLLNRRIEEKDPFRRALEERVSVEVKAMLQITAGTWQIDWQETRFDPSGVQVDSKLWRGSFQVIFRPASRDVDEQELTKNPLGLYVHEFSIAEVQV
jgi:type IV secretion system protein TrbF